MINYKKMMESRNERPLQFSLINYSTIVRRRKKGFIQNKQTKQETFFHCTYKIWIYLQNLGRNK